jgi:hypothetical protein
MKSKLPRLTLTTAAISIAAMASHSSLAVAQPPRVAAVERTTAESTVSRVAEQLSLGDLLIRQASAQLERHATLRAKLRYHLTLDGRQLAGAGSYWQEGSGHNLHIRLELRIAGETNLVQVSNGRFMWTDLALPTGRKVSRLDLRQLRSEALLKDSALANDLDLGQSIWSPLPPQMPTQTCGLPALVAALESSFTFSPPQAMRWTPSPPLPGIAESLPVFAVVGRWKRDQLLLLLPKLERPGGGISDPPERVPQEVLLLIGQSDMFPYRVEYRRLNDPATAKESEKGRMHLQLSAEPLVLLEYFNVEFNAPIAVGQFDYSPGDTEWNDRTGEHLEYLRHLK